MSHWLYRVIPASRSAVAGPFSWLSWAFFGNDDGGIFGERDHYGAYFPELKPSLWLAVQWWCRNPAANLFKVVLAWKRDPVRILAQWLQGSGWSFWINRTPQEKWIGDGPQFTLAAIPPGIAWKRLIGTEGYLGWHSSGWFGMAFRRAT